MVPTTLPAEEELVHNLVRTDADVSRQWGRREEVCIQCTDRRIEPDTRLGSVRLLLFSWSVSSRRSR